MKKDWIIKSDFVANESNLFDLPEIMDSPHGTQRLKVPTYIYSLLTDTKPTIP